jgi:hypothetical protein
MNDSKTRDEIVQRAQEASALVRETTQIFRQSVGIYFSRVADQMRAVVKRAKDGKITPEGRKELDAISEEMTVVLDMIRRHKVILERTMKVAVHKNQAKAYERLRSTLDRMKQESETYQKKLRQIAETK